MWILECIPRIVERAKLRFHQNISKNDRSNERSQRYKKFLPIIKINERLRNKKDIESHLYSL